MNPGRLAADGHALARRYVRCMQAVRRVAGGDPGMVADAGMGIAAAGLTALAVWGPNGLVGATVAGPAWLLALLPLLMGVALTLRRRAPLAMWTAIWAGVALEDMVTRQPPQTLAFLLVLFAGAYALGAYASLRRAAVRLAISGPDPGQRGFAAGLLTARGRGEHGRVLHPAPGLLAGRRARPRPPAVRRPDRAQRGAAAPGRAGRGRRAGADRPGTARHRRPSPQRGRAPGGRRPGIGEASRAGPGEDREQRAAGAGRHPPASWRPA